VLCREVTAVCCESHTQSNAHRAEENAGSTVLNVTTGHSGVKGGSFLFVTYYATANHMRGLFIGDGRSSYILLERFRMLSFAGNV
jgi:hypothetical protein